MKKKTADQELENQKIVGSLAESIPADLLQWTTLIRMRQLFQEDAKDFEPNQESCNLGLHAQKFLYWAKVFVQESLIQKENPQGAMIIQTA